MIDCKIIINHTEIRINMEQFIIYSTLSNIALAYFFRSIHALCFSIIDASSRWGSTCRLHCCRSLIKMALEKTPLSDRWNIARYIRASFAIVGNCVLCILHHSKRSKEAMTTTDLFSKSRSQTSFSLTVLRRLLHHR